MAKKNLWNEEIVGIKVKSIVAFILIVVALYVVASHYGAFDKMSVTDGDSNSNPLKIEKNFELMKIGSAEVADTTANYNDESKVVAVQIDAERSANGTYTTFDIKAGNVSGGSQVVKTVTQTGVLSVPSTAVTVPVEVHIDMSWVEGFTSTDQIMTSTVSASASTLKSADGEKYSPVVMKNNKPDVRIDDASGVKKYTWKSSDDGKSIVVKLDLDWEGINKMTPYSDEVNIPITFSNSDNPETVLVRLIKVSAL